MSSIVYFLSDGDRLIKIGRTSCMEARMRQLRYEYSKPLTLLGTVQGGSRIEAAIHRELGDYREVGEWFRDCEEVRSAVSSYLDGSSVVDDLPSLETFAPISVSIDPTRLNRAESTLAALRAERLSLERQLNQIQCDC